MNLGDGGYNSTLAESSIQCMVHRPGAAASPGSIDEMRSHELHTRPTVLESAC